MAIGTLTIGPNVDTDFLLITNGTPPIDVADINYEPTWDEHSKFMAKFEHTLRTGNLLADGTPPTSWSIYRQKVGSDEMEFVLTAEGAKVVCYDYMPHNYGTYFYRSFAKTESDMSEDITSPNVTPSWPGWALITLDETEDGNRYIPHEIFMFQYNLEIADMTNNTTYNKLETFTKYPVIQRSSANHMSGQLKGLLGGVDCATGRYYNTLEEVDAIRALTTDPRRKILKDLSGHVFEVELSAGIIFSVLPNVEREPYYATIQWTEVGDANSMRVVALQGEYDKSESLIAQGEYSDFITAHSHEIKNITGLTERLDELAKSIEENQYELPAATDKTLGGLIVGDGLEVSPDGTVAVDEVRADQIKLTDDLVIDLGGAEE